MLVISRQRDETITIGDDVEVTVVDIREDKVRLGVNCPKELSVHRKEVYDAIRRENRAAQRVEAAPIREPLNPISNYRAERLRRLGLSTNPVQLRPAVDDDMAYVNEIYNHYVGVSTCTYQEEPDSLESRHKWFAAHGQRHPIIVAEIEGTVIGWGSISPLHCASAYRFAVEDSVYVHHEFHRRGIGAVILQDLIGRARAIGHHAIIGSIDADQTASLALHAKHDFKEAGHFNQVGFKFNRWLDVIYMELLL